MERLYINHYSVVNALGAGKQQILNSIQASTTGLMPCNFKGTVLNTHIGEVAAVEDYMLPEELSHFDCRNNRLAHSVLQQDNFANSVKQKIQRYGKNRVAVVIGTSTSGIEELEISYRKRDHKTGALPKDKQSRYTYNLFSVSDFIQAYFDTSGPCFTISTACSSSAKVFASAARLIESGICDAAIVGGVDSLCLNTLHGFDSLQILSDTPCRPFASNRNGISIGEGGGFALIEKQPDDDGQIMFTGYGESTDAYHMSTPPPDGSGAKQAMQQALLGSSVNTAAIDYINLHGTGSQVNDQAESNAITSVFNSAMLATGTKGFTGHTLGAAGITEAIISFLSLEHQFVPATVNTRSLDDEIELDIQLSYQQKAINYVMSNSFGFGGNNCSLVFGLR